jgi:hypothetical protein
MIMLGETVKTGIVDGKIVFGPIVITVIDVGIITVVAVDGKKIKSVAGVTDGGMLTIVTLGGIVITGIDVGKTVFGPTVITVMDGGMNTVVAVDGNEINDVAGVGGVVTIETLGGIVITGIDGGTMVFGPIVMTVIDDGMYTDVAVETTKISDVAGGVGVTSII